MKLLTPPDSQSKMEKARAFGHLSAILHLAPGRLSGYQVCPHATAECLAVCLDTAGRGGMGPDGICPRIRSARIARTRLLFQDPAEFARLLLADLAALDRMADRLDAIPTCRLNGTSDLPWERIPAVARVMDDYAHIRFYDYTKNVDRAFRMLGSEYHLSLSFSGHNESDCVRFLEAGGNVSAVFRSIPDTWHGFQVVDGDVHDLRFLDGPGVVCGLHPKGRAKRIPIGGSAFIVEEAS